MTNEEILVPGCAPHECFDKVHKSLPLTVFAIYSEMEATCNMYDTSRILLNHGLGSHEVHNSVPGVPFTLIATVLGGKELENQVYAAAEEIRAFYSLDEVFVDEVFVNSHAVRAILASKEVL